MKKIYYLNHKDGGNYFMSIEGIAKYINGRNPKDGKFYVKSGIIGDEKTYYDVTAKNIKEYWNEFKKQAGNNFAPAIYITEDFGFTKFETEFVISEIEAYE